LGRFAQGITNRAHGNTETEDQRIQDSHSQSYASFSTFFLRGVDQHRPVFAGPCRSQPQQRFRLVGVGLGNFHDPDDSSIQPALFA